jgi:phosphoglycerate dehydrogenase-like enzyme
MWKFGGVEVRLNTIRSHNGKIDNISFERAEEFKYLVTNLTNQNSIQEEVKSTVNSAMLAIIRRTIFVFELAIQKLREERRLRVSENRVLRKIFGPKRDEITGEWRKLHNGELNYLYSSSNIVRVIKP